MIRTKIYSNLSIWLGIVAILLIPAYLLLETQKEMEKDEITKPEFVGVQSCIECHQAEYADWLLSDHRKAMDYATAQSVLGNFNDVTIEAQENTHHFFMKDGKYMVTTDGADGTMQDFEVKYVFGYTPLQQYLVEFPGGRLQTLALTWDTENKRWYHMADAVYVDQDIEHSNWLHWTNQAQNWNSMCADCHSTNLVKGYDPETDSYKTTFSEINVSCEACHGPASEHIKWAELPEYAREDISNYGLVVKTSGIDHTQYVETCVRCHSRRAIFQDFDHSAASIYDHVLPQLPQEPEWFLDGQILEEDYVYASFMQSKMHMKEVQCNDCHNVHSGQLLYGTDYNRLCAQCHLPDIYDTPEHHFHKLAGMDGEAVVAESGKTYDVGSGTLCMNCHMHGRYYMGVDYRPDHSFRIPRPDLSITYGVPNACNQCHTDKSNEWSEEYITEWFGKRRRYHPVQTFAERGGGGSPERKRLERIAEDELYPSSIRAMAIEHLAAAAPEDSTKSFLLACLSNLDPLLRLAAVRTLEIVTPEDVDRISPLLRDETKAVRIEVARNLMRVGEARVPVKYKESYRRVLDEYLQVLLYNSDFPIGKFNLANFYYNQGKNEEARDSYLKALAQDGQLHMVRLNLARCYNRMGDNERAAEQFEEYLKHAESDAQALYSYGLLLAEMKEYEKSLQMMTRSYEIDIHRPRVAHNIAMMYDFMGDKRQTEIYLKREKDLMHDYNSNAELLRFYLRNGMNEKALQQALKFQREYPDAHNDLQEVIKQLQIL